MWSRVKRILVAPTGEYIFGEGVATFLRWTLLLLAAFFNHYRISATPRLLIEPAPITVYTPLVDRWLLGLGVVNLILSLALLLGFRPSLFFGLFSLTADILVFSGAIYFNGGLASPFYVFYFILILSAAIRFGQLGGLFAALLSSVGYGAVVYGFGATAPLVRFILPADVLFGIRVLFFFLAGLVGGLLSSRERAQRLRREESERILEEQARRLQEMVTLQELGERLSRRMTDPGQVMELIGEVLGQRFPDASIMLFRLDERRNRLILERGRRLPEENPALELELGEGVVGYVARSGRPINVRDVRRTSFYVPYVPETRSELAVPLRVEDRILGVVNLERPVVDGFGDEDVRFVSIVAAQGAVALANALRYQRTNEALERRVYQLSLIEELDRELATTLEFQRVLELVLQRALEFTGAEAGWIGERRPDGLRVLVHQGYPEAFDRYRQEPIDLEEQPLLAEALEEGRTVRVPDVGRDPRYRSFGAAMGALLAVPVRMAGEVAGLLVLEHPEEEGFTDDLVEFVAHLSEHAAIAMENARRFEAEQRRGAQLEVLAEVSARLAAAATPEELARSVVTALRRSLRYDMVALFRLEDDELVLEAVDGEGVKGMEPGAYRQPVTEGLLGRAVRLGQTVVVQDVRRDPDWIEGPWQKGIRSEVCVPVHLGGRVVAALSVSSRQLQAFSQEDVVVLEAVTDHVATAMERAQLFREAQLRAEEIAQVYRISQEMSRTLELEEILRLFFQELGKLIPFQAAELCLWEESLEAFVSIFLMGEDLSARVYRMGEGLTGWIGRHRQPLLVGDLWERSDLRPARGEEVQERIRSYLGVPLIMEGKLVGVLELADPEPHRFTERHLRLLLLLATQLAQVLRNTRLFEEQQALAREQFVLYEVTRALTGTLDPEEVLPEVLESVAAVLEAQGTFLLLSPEAEDEALELAAQYVAEGRGPEPGLRVPWKVFPAWEELRKGHRVTFRNRSEVDLSRLARQRLEEWGIVAAHLEPVWRGGKVVGLLIVGFGQEHEMVPRHQDFVRSVALQIGVALETARLFRETERRAEQMALLNQISQAMTASLDLRQTLRNILLQVRRVVPYDGGELNLYDPRRDVMVSEFQVAHTDRVAPGVYRRGEGYTGWIWEHGQPLLVRDAARFTETRPKNPQVVEEGLVRSFLGVPLRLGTRMLGTLEVYSREPNLYDEEDLALLEVIAAQAAQAIENARRYELTDEQLARRIRQLAALQQVAHEMNATLDPNAILRLAVKEAVSSTVADYSLILLWNEERERLELKAAHGYTQEELARLQEQVFTPDQGVVGRVFRTGERILIGDVSQAEEYVPLAKGVRSEMAVPIRVEGEVVGVINVESRHLDAFQEEDVLFLEALAEDTGTALGNVRRFQELVRERERAQARNRLLDAVLALGRLFSAEMDLEEYLTEVAYTISEALEFRYVLINLVDDRDPRYMRRMAAAGIPLTEFERLRRDRPTVEYYERFFRPEFQLSRSYFVPYPYSSELVSGQGVEIFVPEGEQVVEDEKAWHPEDIFMIPFYRSDGSLLGVISVDVPYNGLRPTEDVAEALELFARQAAVAVENVKLVQVTHQRARQQEALFNLSARLAVALDEREICRRLVDQLHESLGYDYLGVFLVDERTGDRVLFAHRGWEDAPEGWRIPPGQGLSERPLLDGQVHYTPDVTQEPNYVPGLASGAEVDVPIRVGDRIAGVLVVESQEPHAFRDEDLALLLAAANQAGLALERARLFRSTQQRLEQVTALLESARALSTRLEPTEVFQTMVDLIHRYLPVDTVALMAVEGEELRPVATSGLPESFVQEMRVRIGEGLSGQVAASGEPLSVEDVLQDRRAKYLQFDEEAGLHAYLGVPIVYQDKVLGVLSVMARKPGTFSQEHVDLLMGMADQAAVALENARLFAESQRRLQEVTTLNRIGRALSAAVELDDLMETLHREVARVLPAENFYVALLEEEDGEERIVFPYAVDRGKVVQWASRPWSNGLTEHILRTGKPLFFEGGEIEAWLQELGVEPIGEPARSWLGVPIVAEGKVIGVMAVQDYEREGVYGREHLNLMTAIASQASLAIQRARAFAELRRFSAQLERMVEERTQELVQEKERLEALNLIAHSLSGSLDRDQVIHHSLVLASQYLHAPRGILAVLEDGQVMYGGVLEGPEKVVPWKGEAAALVALRDRVRKEKALLVRRREEAAAEEVRAWMERWGVESLVAVALQMVEVQGVLAFAHPEPEAFDEGHLRFLTALSGEVGIALNNATLYQFISEQADRLAEALRLQEEEAAKTLSILQSIADGVVVADARGQIILLNPAAAEILGVDASEMLGQPIQRLPGVLARDLDPEQMEPREARFELEDRFIAAHYAPVRSAAGERLGTVVIFRDITRDVEVERMKNEFISSVSHELRTPLTSIKGYVDLILMGSAGNLTDAQKNFLEVVRSNANRLVELINDILDISRMETGRLQLELTEVALDELLKGVATSMQAQFEQKEMQLHLEIADELPSIRADERRVLQIVNNLVSNAWKYTPAGGEVWLRAFDRGDGFVQIEVQDTGVGIKEEDLPKLFGRFVRLDNPMRDEVGGTGLGLAITKSLVELHHGRIWVESEYGKGSTFFVALPISGPEVEAEGEEVEEVSMGPQARPPRGGSGQGQPSHRILIFEPDAEARRFLRYHLEEAGYTTLWAADPEGCLELARKERPDLFLLSLDPEEEKGRALLERLARAPELDRVPILLLSGLAEERVERLQELGLRSWLRKPVTQEQLLEMVEAQLREKKGERPRILVAEDDVDLRTWMVQVLRDQGFRVQGAGSADALWEALAAEKPDLLILDLHLGSADGEDLIRRLRKHPAGKALPILVVTGTSLDREFDRVRVLGAGAQEFLEKPFAVEDLLREIHGLLQDRR